MKRSPDTIRCRKEPVNHRRAGSTLIIVLALLGLLSMLGFVFFSFASAERENAEFYSEALKSAPDSPDDGFEWGLRNILVGAPQNRYNSSLHGGYHSMVPNLVGFDSRPLTGNAIDGTGTAANGQSISRAANNGQAFNRQLLPSPDVDYDYPDINNLFLGYVGFTVRSPVVNPPVGSTASAELIPLIIPSFMRPINHPETATALRPLDTNWHSNALTTRGAVSFRPHPTHVYINRNGRAIPAGGGTFVRRFLTSPDDDAIISALPGGSGAWPFAPPQSGDGSSIEGEMGVWTHPIADLNPSSGVSPLRVYELDVDNDGDGTPDSIWQDFDYSVLEDPNTGAKYTLMHAALILDLDALINLNTAGNLAGLEKNLASYADTAVPLGGLHPAIAGRTASISESNLGLTPSEINPTWAMLRAFPTTGFDWSKDHIPHFGRIPVDVTEAANMELMWLMSGRAKIEGGDIRDLFVGRWGEPDRLLFAMQQRTSPNFPLLLPRPGIYDADDDGNLVQGAFGFGQRAFGQPLDFDGSGRYVELTDPRFAQYHRNWNRSGTPNTVGPIQWMQYTGYSLFDRDGLGPQSPELNLPSNAYVYGRDDNAAGLDHIDALIEYDAATSVSTARINTQFDHESETIVEPESARRPYDEIFGAKDLAELFIQPSDAKTSIDPVGDRISKLLPYTFGDTSDISIRNRFTTMSWRYRLLSLASALGPNGRFDNGTGDDGVRAWEFNADTSFFDTDNDGVLDPNGKFEFPPQFNGVRPFVFGSRSLDTVANLNEDPFRPQARRMLRIEVGDQKAEFGQRPLNVNQLVDVERLPNRPADLIRGVLETRPLTEHPLASDAGTNTTTGSNLATWSVKNGDNSLPQFPPETVEEREFWARRDRQKMARDIYVLLYTLCGGQDAVDTTQDNFQLINVAAPSYTTPIYTPEQLHQMAQFAVNLVDALDRDDVITKFEYDRNLGSTTLTDSTVLPPVNYTYSGWNLDDNPDTASDVVIPGTMTPATGFDINDFERGVVYGVERQQVTFSEVLGILSAEIPSQDHPATPWDDRDGNRLHLFIELQNLLPRTINLFTDDGSSVGARNPANATWRIRRIEPTGSMLSDRTLEFLPESENAIAPGGLFSIGANYQGLGDETASTSLEFSDYYIDADPANTTFECIAPLSSTNLPSTSATPSGANPEFAPRTNLDTAHDAHRITEQRFAIDRTTSPDRGAFLNTINTTTLDPTAKRPVSFELVLERRANLDMPSLPAGNNVVTAGESGEGINDWVIVDRVLVEPSSLNIQMDDDPTRIQLYLAGDSNPDIDASTDPGLRSTFRSEPLDGSAPLPTQAPNRTYESQSVAFPYSLNSIRAEAAADSFGWHTTAPSGEDTDLAVQNLQQVHFDRDFASVVELLDLPLCGPDSLTTFFNESRKSAASQVDASNSNPSLTVRTWTDNGSVIPDLTLRDRPAGYGLVAGAVAKFLAPEPRDTTGAFATNRIAGVHDNRWYRLLGFVEVPTKMHRQLGNPVELERVPGAINLNTLRHPQVLAALIDEPLVADTLQGTPPIVGGLEDVTPRPGVLPTNTTTREDWFWELVKSRDGSFVATDSFGTEFSVNLPGWAGSIPMRSLVNADTTLPSKTAYLNRTLLRPSTTDLNATASSANAAALAAETGAPTNPRRLFEIGTAHEHQRATMEAPTPNPNALLTQQSNSNLRHRLLAKILNNSSTTSNAFVVFMTVGHFEVFEDPTTGAIRIGGEYDLNGDGTVDQLDRKRAMFVIDRSEAFEAYDEGSGQFDWRRLVKHRVDIQ